MTDPIAAKAAVKISNETNEQEEKAETLSEVRATRLQTLRNKTSNKTGLGLGVL